MSIFWTVILMVSLFIGMVNKIVDERVKTITKKPDDPLVIFINFLFLIAYYIAFAYLSLHLFRLLGLLK
jgi:hypothetical protein